MPVSRRAYRALQARYELVVEQRDVARSHLKTSRSVAVEYAGRIEGLQQELKARSVSTVTTAEHAQLKRAYAALERQLLDVQASNELMCREAVEKAEAAR
ncbi:hypothetical protein [Streptomyces sp. NPDC048659]|uniref:hypothetical protein n=1 Tax=Streptomyces sp. NPDC048659 TaxID=3155489 RepID=UPI00342C0C11